MSQRTKNEGLTYLRRSTGRQEASMPMQLQWAISQAAKHEVRFNATPEDLDHMLAQGLQQYKDIYLDDGISGSDLERPGFCEFHQAALANSQVSHVFIQMSDRFARPELAWQAMQLEMKLLLAGITIVFSNRVSCPRQLGNSYFAEDMQLLFEYSQNGDFLLKLSQRVLETQIRLAGDGYWHGGTAPYGFVRVLVDASGKEIRELADGETVKMEGCHVRIKPKDREKIRVWLLILHLHGQKEWGHKRIANYLTYELGIPSPNAGKLVRRKGKLVTNSGRWWGEVVKGLIRNEAILGLCAFGKTSSGKHRRFGTEGPRLLEDSDRNEKGVAKRIIVPIEQRIVVSTGYKPSVDEKLFRKCQALSEKRGQHQRDIPRAQDLAKYPLSTRIIDITPGCGATLYGRTESNKQKYECSRYRNSGGRECARNVVDGEEALRFVLGVLQQRTVQCGGREKLRAKLIKIAAAQQTEKVSGHEKERQLLKHRIDQLQREIETIEGNMSLAGSESSFKAIEKRFQGKQADLKRLLAHIAELPPALGSKTGANSIEVEVDAAMALFDDLCHISGNKDARSEIASVLKRIDLKLGLKFMDNPRGKRPKRVVQGGLVTIGPGQNLFPTNDCGGDHPPGVDDGNGDLVSLDVGKILPATETCQHEGQSFSKERVGLPSSADANRAAAEWVLGIGGTVTVRVGEEDQRFSAAEELPQEAFEITSVSLRNNKQVYDEGLEQLKGLTRLTNLDLAGTLVRDADLEHLKELTGITGLHLANTQVSDAGLEHLKGLTGVTHLFIYGTQVSDAGLEYLKGMTGLTNLFLQNTQVSDAGLVHLKGMADLDTLWLNGTQVGDAGLEHLKGLTRISALHLAGTQVSDAGLEHLVGLKKLKVLSLADTQVTDKGVAELHKALPNCKIGYGPKGAPKTLGPSNSAVNTTGSLIADRTAAEWVLRMDGGVHISAADNKLVNIDQLENLPESFTLKGAYTHFNLK